MMDGQRGRTDQRMDKAECRFMTNKQNEKKQDREKGKRENKGKKISWFLSTYSAMVKRPGEIRLRFNVI